MDILPQEVKINKKRPKRSVSRQPHLNGKIHFTFHLIKASLSPGNYKKIPLTNKGTHASCCSSSASVDTSCWSSISEVCRGRIVPRLQIL